MQLLLLRDTQLLQMFVEYDSTVMSLYAGDDNTFTKTYAAILLEVPSKLSSSRIKDLFPPQLSVGPLPRLLSSSRAHFLSKKNYFIEPLMFKDK